jgi:coenzyme F420-0:L-glutamate ligase/coenzyme F420-1:gamma-L-glutamate ligase
VSIELIGVEGLPEVRPGDDLAILITEQADLRPGDVLVVAQKAVSKAEGMIRDLREVIPSDTTRALAARLHRDPRLVQLVLDEARVVVRDTLVLIVETRHGYVCANAGIDHSNVDADPELVTLLPRDCDVSAEALRIRIRELTSIDLGIIVSDTFGRAWREGITNVALGVAGMPATHDHRGELDDFGHALNATVVALADEIAAAAELVMGKTRRIPAVVVRGLTLDGAPGSGRDLIRPLASDLFR